MAEISGIIEGYTGRFEQSIKVRRDLLTSLLDFRGRNPRGSSKSRSPASISGGRKLSKGGRERITALSCSLRIGSRAMREGPFLSEFI